MTNIIINMKNTTQILDTFFKERNSSHNTKNAYMQSVRIFEKYTHQPLYSIMYLAEMEQEKNTNWKNQSLRILLINFRDYLYKTYKMKSAKLHLSRIIAIFRHFEITIPKLPYYSTKSATPSIPINPDKLVDRDILKLCINTKNPLLKAITLLMSSSGLSKADSLNLTVQDFLNATYEYHHEIEIGPAIQKLQKQTDVIGFWENLQRQKTGMIYFTFSSPESSTAIIQYLLTREKITSESPLFDIHYKYLSDLFKETNDMLNLGKNGQYSRFAAHMLRRYHATQLIEAGMSESKVDLLQGRKPRSIAYQSYVKIKPSKLRSEYIAALPYIVIEDYNQVKTELDMTKDKLDVVNSENVELKSNFNKLWDEINDLKKRQKIWNELKKGE